MSYPGIFSKDFFMVYKGMFQINSLKKTDKMAYIYLSSICINGLNHSYANLKELSQLFGISRPTFKVVVNRLEEAELVEKIGQGNKFYIINNEDLNLRGNFFFMHYAVLRTDKITPRQKLIYAYLLSRSDRESMIAEVSIKSIAKNCAIRDDINIREDINQLVLKGLITKKLLNKKYKGRLQYGKYQYKCLQLPSAILEEQNNNSSGSIQSGAIFDSIDDFFKSF
ncbi:helix-turn-helix domain-containing protein [Mesobacillus subterraneus]|uniref:helix-turn-helix domain-containing protein n=1 Tax=Mesobacillus subterraneus TaxID=285983 RepID=UPI001CFDAA58|nr:helix-turn-helix domain-containing protein [Mesobacillus subterraneus]WLR55944.1 helix-turn-helix domain-containing protein [Mesobacillus subterraneus]